MLIAEMLWFESTLPVGKHKETARPLLILFMEVANMTNTQQILINRHYLVSTAEQGDKKLAAYYSAFLFSNFGILTDRPYLLTKEMVNEIKGKKR